ncbi:MAG TPA: nitrous oxide reductase accessory protein NosL [Saprospiraceae bacterium]|nr:nitrous oxide reductase accessory protein NosL [Saprospiraceae bacterium]
MNYTIALSTLVVCIVSACTPSPQEIHYGEDACRFCLMTIVDERHAAELVTTKGKAYKFDAIECLMQEMQEAGDQEYAYVLVSDYDHPRTLIDAETATYLVSPSIPSPMGAFLSAFNTGDRAIAVQKENEGQVYDWQSLQKVFHP